MACLEKVKVGDEKLKPAKKKKKGNSRETTEKARISEVSDPMTRRDVSKPSYAGGSQTTVEVEAWGRCKRCKAPEETGGGSQEVTEAQQLK